MTEERKQQPSEAIAAPDDDRPICFTIQPFKGYFGGYWDTIYSPAIEAAGMKPMKGNSIFSAGQVIDHIWELTQQATVILAELSTLNANVFYELGLAHALGKPTVMIAEHDSNIPFDIHHQRRIIYDKNLPDWGTTLKEQIILALTSTLEDPVKSVPATFIKANEVQPEDYDINDFQKRLLALENSVFNIKQTRQMLTFSLRGEILALSESELYEFVNIYNDHGKNELFEYFNAKFPSFKLTSTDDLTRLVQFLAQAI